MALAHKSKAPKKDKQVAIRFTSREIRDLEKLALSKEVTVSEYVRTLVREQLPQKAA